jgi:hypothetical protein
MLFVINQPLASGGEKIVTKLTYCGARTTSYDDGKPRVIIEFDIKDTIYTAKNLAVRSSGRFARRNYRPSL